MDKEEYKKWKKIEKYFKKNNYFVKESKRNDFNWLNENRSDAYTYFGNRTLKKSIILSSISITISFTVIIFLWR